MCVYQHSTDILKALFSFLVDVRLYWTCVDQCQTNRANLPCKEIQIRQKAFNNMLHYGGKGLVYHCFAVFHSCLVARLPKTLQVATEMTERCFVEHKIVSVLKSDSLLGML